MTKFYDARGNIYGVVSPQQVRDHGIGLPQSAVQAAQARESWATAAVHAFCAWAPDEAPPDAKAHRSDGLLIGPFQSEPPFDLLIVNTDGTLAERSGNGLTIFSQALQAQGLMPGAGECVLQVHHDKPDGLSPLQTSVRAAEFDGVQGFWLDLGKPLFGVQAVGAQEVESVLFNQCDVSQCGGASPVEPSVGPQPVREYRQSSLRDAGGGCRGVAGQFADACCGAVAKPDSDCLCGARWGRRPVPEGGESAMGLARSRRANRGPGVRAR